MARKKSAPKKAAKKAAQKKAAQKKATKKTAQKKATKKTAKKKATKKSAKKKAAKKSAAKKSAAKKSAAKKSAAKKTAKKSPAQKKTAKKAAPKPAASSLPAAASPKPGTRAPNFVLPADDGSEVSLSSLQGKKVVLYFYPKDDTPGCTTEACGFRDLHQEFEKRGAVVLGVSKDSVKKHDSFKKKYDLPFKLLSDESAEVISAYGSWGQKKFMGRTFDGILRTTVLIDPEGKIAKVYPKVAVAEHPDEVLKDLEAM